MDFIFHSQRVRESADVTSKTRAKEVDEKRKRNLKAWTAGIRREQKAIGE